MKVTCDGCGKEHLLKDAEIAGHAKVQFRCSKCGETTVVEIKLRVDSTVVMSPLPSFATTGSGGSSVRAEEVAQQLPPGVTASLSVIAGPDQGVVRQIQKAQVILGRQGADISLNDPEISRHHCLLEVKDTYISLKDMDSTNGTFVDEERARAAMLQDGSEFRIGSSVIRVCFHRKY